MIRYGHIYDDNLCKQFGSRSCPIKMSGLIWIQPDTRMYESRIICSLRYLLTHISLASYFVGHRQTAQS